MSLAWSLSQCPTLLLRFLRTLIPGHVIGQLDIHTQSFGDDGGFTDIELFEAGRLHVIIEAKKGWWLPTTKQFRRYMPRFAKKGAPRTMRFLMSMSDASEIGRASCRER